MRRPVRQPKRWRVRHGGKVVCDTDRAVEAIAYLVDEDRYDYTVSMSAHGRSPVVIWPPAEQLVLNA